MRRKTQHPLAHLASHVLGLSGFPVADRFSADALARLIDAHGFEVIEEDQFASSPGFADSARRREATVGVAAQGAPAKPTRGHAESPDAHVE